MIPGRAGWPPSHRKTLCLSRCCKVRTYMCHTLASRLRVCLAAGSSHVITQHVKRNVWNQIQVQHVAPSRYMSLNVSWISLQQLACLQNRSALHSSNLQSFCCTIHLVADYPCCNRSHRADWDQMLTSTRVVQPCSGHWNHSQSGRPTRPSQSRNPGMPHQSLKGLCSSAQ